MAEDTAAPAAEAPEAAEAAEAAAETTPPVELSPESQQVVEIVKGLPALELSRLVKALEEEFGVSAAAPMAMMPAAGAAGAEEPEEQTSFDVHLTEIGQAKIQVIKAVRAVVGGLGLKEAKALVDSTPTVVKKGASKEEAEKVQAALIEAGATVEIK